MDLYKELFRSAFFNLGFFITGFVFLVFNLLPRIDDKLSLFSASIYEYGFPLINLKIYSGMTSTYKFDTIGLIADALIGVICCFAVGLICKFISSRLSTTGR